MEEEGQLRAVRVIRSERSLGEETVSVKLSIAKILFGRWSNHLGTRMYGDRGTAVILHELIYLIWRGASAGSVQIVLRTDEAEFRRGRST